MTCKMHILAVCLMLVLVACAGCGKPEEPPPASEKKPGEPVAKHATVSDQDSMERLAAENQWLREQLKQMEETSRTISVLIDDNECSPEDSTLGILLSPGSHQLAIRQGEEELHRVLLKVDMPPKEVLDPDRKAAGWVLEMGGAVRLSVDGREIDAKTTDDLPAQGFHVVRIDLTGRNGVGDNSLQNVASLKALRALVLNGTQVSNDGLKYLASLSNLQELCLDGTQVTDEGIPHLTGLTNLLLLSLRHTSISDSSVIYLKSMPQLTRVFLEGTHVTAKGVAELFSTLKDFDLAIGFDPQVGKEYLDSYAQESLQKVAPGWSVVASDPSSSLRPEYLGKQNVFKTHPLSGTEPCVIQRRVEIPADKETSLRVTVTHHPAGDFKLIVKVDGATRLEKVIGPNTTVDGWVNLEVDLSDLAGKQVLLELVHQQNERWYFIGGFWARIDVESR